MTSTHADLIRFLRAWLPLRLERSGTPGAAVAVIMDGEVVLSIHHGHADLEHAEPVGSATAFRLASISKTLTGAAIMQLVQRKSLALTDSIAQHLDWAASSSNDTFGSITIEQVATHTAGLAREGGIRFPHDGYWPNRQQCIEAAGRAEVFATKPSSRLLYSNYGFFVLGEVIAAVTKMPYGQYVREHILEPLGMSNTQCLARGGHDQLATGYESLRNGRRIPAPTEDRDAFAAGGGFVSTLQDMSRWAQFLLRGDDRVLDAATHGDLLRPHWTEPDGKTKWGIGVEHWMHGAHDYSGHGGQLLGWAPRLALDVANNNAVVVLDNAVDGPGASIGNATLKTIARSSSWELGSGATDIDVSRFCGRFENGWGTFAVTRMGEALVGLDLERDDCIDEPDQLSVQNEHELRIDDGRWGSHVGQTIRYTFDASGRPEAINYGSYRAKYAGPL